MQILSTKGFELFQALSERNNLIEDQAIRALFGKKAAFLCVPLQSLSTRASARNVPRLGGALDKKQVWPPFVRT